MSDNPHTSMSGENGFYEIKRTDKEEKEVQEDSPRCSLH